MNANIAAVLYLVAGVLFILALRGLSSPESSRRGNMFGIVGMTIAVLTTLAGHPPQGLGAWILVIAGIVLGGGIGAVIARRVPMTSMPELVAAFHSLVGMAAVLVAAAAFYAPAAFSIGTRGAIHKASLVEMSLGVAIGAITFTGSIIAFLKLSGRMSGAPILLPRPPHHQHRAGAGDDVFHLRPRGVAEPARFLAGHGDRACARRADHHPDRRRRHAGRDLDAELVFRLGRGRHRLHARQFGADHHRRAGRLLGRDPVLHHVQGHEPELHLGHPRRLRRRGRGPGAAAASRSRSRSARRRTPPTS